MNTAPAVLCLAAWSALAGAACKEQPAQPPAVPEDAMRRRRLLQPPPGEVRAVPPHAIHADGVGPYVLGTSLRDVLGMLSRGPRVTLVQIDGVVDYSLVRAESGTLIIGVEPLGAVAFVSVLDAETARTESGIGVGTDSAALAEALGPPLVEPDLTMAPGMVAFASLPSVRFLLDRPGGRVAAVVVLRGRPAGRAVADPGLGTAAAAPGPSGAHDAGVRDASASTCLQGGGLGARIEDIARAAEVTQGAASVRFGCFSGASPEALVQAGDRVIAVGGTPGAEAGPLRRLAAHSAPGVAFAAPLDIDGDGRSEVAVVRQGETAGERRVEVELLRLEGARFVALGQGEVYRLSERSAAWVGASLTGIELLIELRAHGGDVLVSGLYVHRGPHGLDAVAPLLPAVVEARRKRPGAAGAEAAAGRQRPASRPGMDGDAASEGAAPVPDGPAEPPADVTIPASAGPEPDAGGPRAPAGSPWP